MKYVILRRSAYRDVTTDVDTLEALQSGEDVLAVEVEDLDPIEAGKLHRDEEVVAVGVSMPIALIKPLGVLGTAQVPDSDSWGIAAVGADQTTFAGEGVTVAVLDTGIDSSHPAFDKMSLDQRDFTGTGDGDRNGHGTHCAGTIFGRDVGGRRIGIATGIGQALIGKVLDDAGKGHSEAVFEGLKWAMAQKADVISMSLGFDFPGMVAELIADHWPPDLATSVALEAYRANLMMFEAIMRIALSGAPFNNDPIVVAAAGNESQRSVDPNYRIAASIPAACEGVLSVGALGQASSALVIADFSNSRPAVAAPGVDILSAAVGGGMRVDSGTSMACPHVAGVAALWCEALRSSGLRGGGANVGTKIRASAKWDGIVDASEIDVGLGLVACP